MVKKNIKWYGAPIFFLVAIFAVVVSFTGTQITGRAPSNCSGETILYAEPAIVAANSPITFRVGGLTDCNGAQITIRTDSCDGSEVARLECSDSACSDKVKYVTVVGGKYKYIACVYDDSEHVRQVGRRPIASVEVLDKPDFSASDITIPNVVYADIDFRPTFKISSSGQNNRVFADYKYEISGTPQYYREFTDDFTLTWGNSQKIEIPPMALPRGRYILKITVDPLNTYEEMNEFNNVAAKEFDVL